ncbi:MAG: hypothetical protein K2I79_03615 [Clostridia bacterium]|nr:hypothetical protein [Clostridia bacterium]
MKRDKKVLDITQDSLNTLKDEDFKRKLLLEQEALIDERALKKAKGRRFNFAFNFKALASTITCLALISVIICVGLFVPNKNEQPIDKDNNYFDEEKLYEAIEIKELENIFNNHTLSLDNISAPQVAKQKSTQKVLYYTFDYANDFVTCSVMVVIEERYEVEERETNDTVIIDNISLGILSNYNIEDGIYIHNVYGKAVIDGVRVYFNEFSSMSLSEDSGFEQFVAELFGIA